MLVQKIRNYIQLEQIGKGAHGAVFVVVKEEDKAKGLDKKYALKLQVEDITPYELEIINQLKNYNLMNVVRSYEEFKYQEGFMEYQCIIMDYCDQGDLGNFLTKYRTYLNIQQIKDMIYQIAFGIWELQQFQIIHRDLKPQNILLHIEDNLLQLRICDLGLSKIQQQSVLHTINIGTPYYMAPELIQQTESQNYDSSVDIWALGVIIFDFFSKEQLFFGKTIKAIFNQIQNLNIQQKLAIINDQQVKELCEKCLSYDPKKRPTIEMILQQLNSSKFQFNKSYLQNQDQNKMEVSQLKIKEQSKYIERLNQNQNLQVEYINNPVSENKKLQQQNIDNNQIYTSEQNLRQNYYPNNQQIFDKQVSNNQQFGTQMNQIRNNNQEQNSTQIQSNQQNTKKLVHLLKKIKDKPFANKLLSMTQNNSKEEIYKELEQKASQIIKASYEQD